MRNTEASLLCLVLLLLLVGAFVAIGAKGREVPDPGRVLHLNRATAAQIARTGRLPPFVAERIVAERTRRGPFGDVDALGRLPVSAPHDAHPRLGAKPLLSPEQLRDARPRLIVRTWAEARNHFLLSCGLLGLFIVATHVLLRRARPKADPFLFPLVALLCVLGVLLLFGIKDPVRDLPSYASQVWGIVGGGGFAFLVTLGIPLTRLPLHRYGYLYALAALALTLLLAIFGSGTGSVKLSVLGAQPVEAIKVLLVFFLAAYLAERGPLLNDPLRRLGPLPLPRPKDAGPLLVLYALPLVLFALVKDLGPVLLLFGTFLLLVYLATGRGVYVGLGLLALLGGGWLGYVLRFGVFRTRVDMWLSPWSNRHVGGDHLAQGFWALASGGPWGSGLGGGAPHLVPRSGSDLVFASVGEVLGLVGTTLVVTCFLVLVARSLRIARRAGSDFDRLLAAGLACLLALQAVVLISGTLGLLPLAGITLPFVSYGKSSLVASFFCVGMLLALSAKAPETAVSPSRTYNVSAARVTLVFGLISLVGMARLVWIQAVRADRIAARTVRVPDADGQVRSHLNPRLLRLAARIPRGRILDRNGHVLAETRNGRRVYPLGAAAVHLVGYVDPRVGGPTGLEQEHDLALRGFARWSSLVPLWRAQNGPGAQLPRGKDVTLALDARLQKAARAALAKHAASVRDLQTGLPKNRGAVVLLDVSTGGVLAAATLPSFNPSGLTPNALHALRANGKGDFPLIDRALGGYYPPGSTFKIVTAAALFAADRADFVEQCRHIDTNVRWRAAGLLHARQRVEDDEGERAHGLVNLTGAVSESCNVYFARAGIALGPHALRAQAERFGFALLPSLNQFGAELPDIAYGQGPMLASPLEMARVALCVATGGMRLRPQIVKRARPDVLGRAIAPSDAARLAQMMRRVTVSGTAAGRFDALPYAVAGKTGTAQNEQRDKMSHAWFIGFAPADRPKVAFAVLVENGGYGASAAIPIAREVLQAIVAAPRPKAQGAVVH